MILALYRRGAFSVPGASLQLLLAEFDELLLSPALGVGVVMLDGSGAWSLLGKEEIEKGTWSRGVRS